MLDPVAETEGNVKLYIPATSIPQDAAQAVEVFYVDEGGLIDTFSLVVPESAASFLAGLAADAEPQVKATYSGVDKVDSDTYLKDTAASIRADGVTPLPFVFKGLKLRLQGGSTYVLVTEDGKVAAIEQAGGVKVYLDKSGLTASSFNVKELREGPSQWGSKVVDYTQSIDTNHSFNYGKTYQYTFNEGTVTLDPQVTDVYQ